MKTSLWQIFATVDDLVDTVDGEPLESANVITQCHVWKGDFKTKWFEISRNIPCSWNDQILPETIKPIFAISKTPLQSEVNTYGNVVNTKRKEVTLFNNRISKGMRMKYRR